jgi:hypothetical protein
MMTMPDSANPRLARDLDNPQFEWSFQRQLYDALHDYFVEMFIRTPQDRADRQREARQREDAPRKIQ